MYKIESSKLNTEGFLLDDFIFSSTGGFHGWSFTECPQYSFVKLGNVMEGPYSSYKWSEINNAVVPGLVGKETNAVVTGFSVTNNYNLKIFRKNTDIRITDVGFISVTKKACEVHLILRDNALPISSNTARYVSEGGTLGIVVNNDTRNDAFNTTNLDQPGASATVIETSTTDNNGFMRWTRNGAAIGTNDNNPLLNINTLSGLSPSNLFLVKTYGGDLQATLTTINENLVLKSTIQNSPNANTMDNIGTFCKIVAGISEAFEAVGIENFGFDCKGPNYTIYEYNAEKVGSPLVVRDESGTVSLDITADLPVGPPVPIPPGLEFQLEITGGGGLIFEYDLNKRNPSKQAIYPPSNLMTGESIMLGAKFNLKTVGTTYLGIGGNAEFSVPIELQFYKTSDCDLAVKIELNPIVLTPQLIFSNAKVNLYPIQLYGGGTIYQGCAIE